MSKHHHHYKDEPEFPITKATNAEEIKRMERQFSAAPAAAPDQPVKGAARVNGQWRWHGDPPEVAAQYLYCLLDTCGYCGHCAACGEYLATAGRQLAEQLDNAENGGNE